MKQSSLLSPESFGFEIVDAPDIYVNDRKWVWEVRTPDGYFNLWLCLAGGHEIRLGGETHVGTGAAFYLIPPGQSVAGRSIGTGGLTNFAMHFRPVRPAARRELAGLAAQFREVPVRRPIEIRRMAEECCRGWAAGDALGRAQAHLVGRWLLCEMWNPFARPQQSTFRDRVLTLAMEIRSRPSRPWTAELIARELGLSPSQSARVFGEVIGKPPGRFVVEARIERAGRMLLDSPMRVSEIADALGYGDVYFFSRQFKRFTGLSPTQVRAGGCKTSGA